jgi:predicted flap endonuclease-1-like 5' DNA nuclease
MDMPMFSDGRDPAHTCACCGQTLQATRSLTLQVEETVLDLCNEAFAEAYASGHAHVDVAHLIGVLARTPVAQTIFWQLSLDPALMAAAANRWLARIDRRQGSAPVTASAEMKALLTRAEARAIRNGRTHASLTDVIGLLAELSAIGAHINTSETSHANQAAQTPSHHAVPLQGLLTTTPPRADSRHGAEVQRAQSSADHTTLTELLARLERQETELAALRAAVSTNTSTRSRSNQSASTRASSRGQSYDPGIHALSTQSTADRVHMRRHLRQRQEQARRNRQSDRQNAASRESNGASRSWSQRRAGTSQSRERAYKPAEIERDDDLATGDTAKRFYLSLDDHIERAPSIGPKTAGRLIDAGVATVRDLLAADAEAISGAVRAKFITAQRVRDWQAQARLVCTVPFLRGTHAQLLVGAGYADLDRIVAADPSILCAAILKFATTRDGQSVLRSAPPPDMERIVRWLHNAADAEPARAAA